jgi:hypothetical protein
MWPDAPEAKNAHRQLCCQPACNQKAAYARKMAGKEKAGAADASAGPQEDEAAVYHSNGEADLNPCGQALT